MKAKVVYRPRLSLSLPPDSKRLSSNICGTYTTLHHKYWFFRYYCRDGITVRKGNMYKIKPVRPITPHERKCPFCDPNYKPRDPFRESRCVLNQPLFMVIPPGGVHLSCPIHPEGHHVFGPEISWMESPRHQENNLPDPADKPWCEYGTMTG